MAHVTFWSRWTRVCLAKADSEDGRRALADLCDAYYEPVVAYLRSVFRDAEAAREMSHAFFSEMLGGGTINTAERERGRFRSYLLDAVKHFVAHQGNRHTLLKIAENDTWLCQITFPGDAWAAVEPDSPATIEGPSQTK